MKNKFLSSTLFISILAVIICSFSFATNNMVESAGNAVEDAGNMIKNAAITTKDTVVNGTENLANDIGNMGNNAMNNMENMTGDNNGTTLNMDNNDDYTVQRTATGDTGLFGMSNTLSTWLILGIVGAIIVGLVWYYGSQYEHKNYSND